MLKLVLDTQSAVSGLIDFGAPREIIILAYKKQIQLWGSISTYNEFCRVVQKPRLEKRILSKYLSIPSLNHEYAGIISFCNTNGIEPGSIVPADTDDEEFIRVAIKANSHIVVSRDNHLLDIKTYLFVRIVRPSEFMYTWRNTDHNEPEKIWRRTTWNVWGSQNGG